MSALAPEPTGREPASGPRRDRPTGADGAPRGRGAPPLLDVLGAHARDLAPLVAVIAIFQHGVLREPLGALAGTLGGALLVIVGLTCFVQGLATSLFPLGEGLADAFARRGRLLPLLAFAFALGFGSTVAEPALLAVTTQAGQAAAAAGLAEGGDADGARFALVLRLAASAAVGVAVVLGCLRIVLGWHPVPVLVGAYAAVAALAFLRPSPLLGIALDAGAAATSAINIPLILALGIGLASVIGGRRPLIDGFGVVALASLLPMLAVLGVAALLG